MDLNRGFSLLEVLISIAIFTTALLAISVMLLNTIKGNSVSINLTTATQLASKQIEEIMLMRYSDIRDVDKDATDGLDDHDPATADMSNLNVEAGGTGKRYDIYTNVVEDYPVKNTKTLRVIVAWKHGERDKHARFDFVRTFGE
jgi:prepilin-type N-terminal cleavage/methylation domain-containing protein